MMKLIRLFLILSIATLLLSCGKHNSNNDRNRDPNTLKVGTIAGPETELMIAAKNVAKAKYGLNVEIIEFSDYTTPNVALNDGSIDANVFQHQPYLDSEIKNRGFKITAIARTFIFPMGIYSKKIKKLDALEPGDIVAIPNDPSNEGRALLLLQEAGLITLKDKTSFTATPADIVSNSKRLTFKELNPAQLPRALADVTLAVMNTNYAIPAGFSPTKDALFRERKDSPYANLVVVRIEDQNKLQFLQLVNALHSPEVLIKARQLFGDDAIPAGEKK